MSRRKTIRTKPELRVKREQCITGPNIIRHDGFRIWSTNDVGDMHTIPLEGSVSLMRREQKLEIRPHPYQGAAQDDLLEISKVQIVANSHFAQA